MNAPKPALRPDAATVDLLMIANVQVALNIEYLERWPGPQPTAQQLGRFVSKLGRQDILRIVRGYEGNRSVKSILRVDDDVIRWANALK